MYVKTDNRGTLNLRAEPSPKGKVLARIPYGTQLETSQLDANWSKVTYAGETGYVMNKFLVVSLKKEITRNDLQKIYNSLQETLKLIENIIK